MSQRSGRRDHEGWLWQNVGNYGYDQGKLEEIQRAAHMGREIGEKLSYVHIIMGAQYYEGVLAFLRGDFDEAERKVNELLAGQHAKFEVQITPYLFSLLGEIALARGHLDEAARDLRTGSDLVAGEFMLGMADELLFHLVRVLTLAGRREETNEPLERLRTVAKGRPNSEAFLAWAEGMLAPDPLAGVERLTAAIETFRRLGRPIDEARCLMDRARLMRVLGADGTGDEERARKLLSECGATVFLASTAG